MTVQGVGKDIFFNKEHPENHNVNTYNLSDISILCGCPKKNVSLI